ncbi:TetR/AcrR family transcriptional regulator [Chryseoglobus sp. 28M-23]|uniref:TetR/AcrR family transcriptional regulator n=1 Tax=Chryseoglobus sp. 28M-23 TaxID=2772253 RepID=UPI0017477E1F|nr:TetR/AcrR family transcriptional regulator [Chryseoglobus sp. 28M-23]QOD92768.1 TetR/AcrR family transcriptional regulator [Chryseoglobus sp. 28M-23]
MADTGRRRAAPRRPLSRERIVDAALALADSAGLPGTTMRALAGALGVEAMSLYNHVKNRDDLLDGMVDAVFAQIELPTGAGDWAGEMRTRSHSAHAVLTRHPWAVGLMDSRRAPGPATLRHHDAVLGSLRAGGFSVAGALHAFSLLDSYLYGYCLQEQSLPFDGHEELVDVAEGIAASMGDDYPWLSEAMTQRALAPDYAYADEFAVGLDLILGALAPDAQPTDASAG